jgi:hypothetical protein
MIERSDPAPTRVSPRGCCARQPDVTCEHVAADNKPLTKQGK